MMSKILQGLKGVKCYLDDVIGFGANKTEHNKNLRAVFERIAAAGLKLNEKCLFHLSSLEYLGHKISATGIQPATDRVESILKASTPTNVTELRSFLGLIGYYSKFCPHFATVVEPMIENTVA